MSLYYRFRPIDRLLGDSRELETQTLFFAAPESLNDPMEGLADVVFRGDVIVWENLFRHFIGCLAWAVCDHLVRREETEMKVSDLLVVDPCHTPEMPFVQIIKRLADELVGTVDVQALVSHFASRKDAISEYELRAYLSRLHSPWAVSVLRTLPEAFNEHLPDAPAPDLVTMITSVEAALAELSDDDIASVEKLQVAFQVANSTSDQIALDTWINGNGPDLHNHRFVYVNFVDHYLKSLRTLLYPDWYAACFMDDISNASVWGHYANGHKDVCLKFRARPSNGHDCLSLHIPNAENSDGVMWNIAAVPFKPVSYSPTLVRLNFFTAMGNLPRPILNKVWRSSRMGVLSPIEREVHGDEDKWRTGYWQDIEGSITTKLKDWEYEREYRLTFWSGINDITEPSMRCMKYDFNDLEGIVFGIKTSEADKRRIVQLVRSKCREAGRKDFEFLQAYRSPDGKGISTFPLSVLSRMPID